MKPRTGIIFGSRNARKPGLKQEMRQNQYWDQNGTISRSGPGPGLGPEVEPACLPSKANRAAGSYI